MGIKTNYSSYYASVIVVLLFLLIATNVYDKIGDIEHAKKDLEFAIEIGEFIVFEAEIIGYCANISNMSSDELIKDFAKHKAMEMLDDFNGEVKR